MLPFSNSPSLIARVVGFTGQISTDPSKPDGTPRKLLDSSKLYETWLAAKDWTGRGPFRYLSMVPVTRVRGNERWPSGFAALRGR